MRHANVKQHVTNSANANRGTVCVFQGWDGEFRCLRTLFEFSFVFSQTHSNKFIKYSKLLYPCTGGIKAVLGGTSNMVFINSKNARNRLTFSWRLQGTLQEQTWMHVLGLQAPLIRASLHSVKVEKV